MAKLISIWFVTLLGPLMFGQFQSSSSRSNGDTTEITFSSFNAHAMSTLAGAPYCADSVSENVQTLADGTRITQPGIVTHTCRDSQGRTRAERSLMRIHIGTSGPDFILVEIRDPVGGSFYTLDTQNKIAHRMAIPTQPVAPQIVRSTIPTARSSFAALAIQVAPERREQYNSEQLAAQMIEGVLAEGQRQTTTIPIGSIGNDRPIVTSSESWYSKELGLTVRSKNSDPRQGEQTTRLINISRAEPEMSLFQPPSDYKIVDETGGFTMTLKRQ